VRETVARGPRLVPHPRQRCATTGTTMSDVTERLIAAFLTEIDDARA